MTTILDTMKILLSSKRVNEYQGDGFQVWAHKWVPFNLQWLVLRISDTNFLHCWVTDSIWLECAESLITKQ